MRHDSKEWRNARDARLLELFDGNKSAVEFIVAVSSICELWDDLVDKDKDISVEDTQSAFWNALVVLPTNEFFNKHKAFFIPLIIHGINCYEDSVVLEQGSSNDRAYALTLRMIGVQLTSMVLFLLKGWNETRSKSVDIWREFTSHEDALEWIAKKKTANNA